MKIYASVAIALALVAGLAGQADAKTHRHYARHSSYASSTYYTNVSGHRVHSPSSNPSGATAICGDGSYSYSQHRQGTCSHHGGVSTWL